MRVDVFDTVNDLERTRVEILFAASQALRKLATYAANEAKATSAFKDRTGKLRGSIRSGETSPRAFFVKAGGRPAPYAQWIEAGSRPHEIKARRRKFLRFEQNGQIVFRKRVFHPGTKPARFMESARNSAEAMALSYVEPEINAVLR